MLCDDFFWRHSLMETVSADRSELTRGGLAMNFPKKPWLIRLESRLCLAILRPWMSTVRFRIDTGRQNIEPWEDSLQERFIYCLWHDSIVFASALRSAAPMTVLVSSSHDGELLTRICHSYGAQTIRGSSSRGGVCAMDEIIARGRESHLLIAPDGPRGPRREVKRGLAYLASRTGMRIVPVGVGFQRAWRTKTWDRLALPFPGSTVTCVAGPVIQVPAGLGKKDLETYRRGIERIMLTATSSAEAWAQGSKAAIQWPPILSGSISGSLDSAIRA
jgi:hypothetical protein